MDAGSLSTHRVRGLLDGRAEATRTQLEWGTAQGRVGAVGDRSDSCKMSGSVGGKTIDEDERRGVG